MNAALCIHAHLYQPPREDPWLGAILAEGSAAPMDNWNERILRESYAPLAWARRLDGDNRILELFNCYEWMSFNVGPTLVRWMRDEAPDVLRRMREADEKSLARLGHGNAIAQCFHHNIMPLASRRDKKLETAWAIADFRQLFGRDPEGMWLPECAVDVESLEVLAEHGVKFVILAPRQAQAVIVDGEQVYVTEESLDIREPYRVKLPSGAYITAVFYHGPLSQSIAFEGLLRDGELFWQRIANEARKLQASSRGVPLICLATDGETYGHHFTFGEMALAHALAQGRSKRDNIRLTNLAAHIAANPPTREVILHEPSSWSCAHGVERWRSDCGCTDGGHANWNQQWRAPLREALNIMREAVDAHFAAVAPSCFTDPEAALSDYGRVLANPDISADFDRKWFRGGADSRDAAWKLLAMQEQALAAFASCAWFFDDIARIEPENAMTFALRAMELMRETNGPDVQDRMVQVLEKAASNQPEAGSGKDVFLKEVLPRRDDPAVLCMLACLLHHPECFYSKSCKPATFVFPNLSVELLPQNGKQGADGLGQGKAIIRLRHETVGSSYVWRMLMPSHERFPGAPYVTLEDSVIHVRPEEAAEGEEISRKAMDLSRSMRDYLLAKNLESWERFNRPELRAVAGNALSLISPWQEAQRNVTRPEYWVGFTPYMLVESMLADGLSVKKRMQVEQILAQQLAARSKTLARRLVIEAFVKGIDLDRENGGPCKDATFAEWARRVRFVMPDMDWWEVQNKIWDLGISAYPCLAAEIGFAASA